MTSSMPTLYTYFRSSCSWRVRAALLLKEIKFESRAINLLKQENKSDDYKAICPLGQVPAIIINGITMTQSLAIIEYLEEEYKDRGVPLLPSSPADRATVRELSYIIACNIQPLQNPSVAGKAAGEAKGEWAKFWIDNGFASLEKRLIETAGKYCFKNEISMADLCLVPQLYNARRFGVDVAAYPTISRVEAALLEVDAIVKAAPHMQADCPEELRMAK